MVAGDFQDADIEGAASAAVKITTLPSAGILVLDGVAMTLNQIVAKAVVDAGKLIFFR